MLWGILTGRHDTDEQNIAMLGETYREVDSMWQEVFGDLGKQRDLFSEAYDVAGQPISIFFEKDRIGYSLRIVSSSGKALPETLLLGRPVNAIDYRICEYSQHSKISGSIAGSDQIISTTFRDKKEGFLQEMESFKTKGLPAIRQLFSK